MPTNPKGLFNLRYSTLHTKVEHAFGKLKNHFKIFTSQPFFAHETQVNLMLVAYILHNYILGVDPNNQILQLPSSETEDILSHLKTEPCANKRRN